MYKTIKALEGITRNNGNTLILPIIIVQGTVPVYTDWLVFSGYVYTLPDNFSCRHESMITYPICDSSLKINAVQLRFVTEIAPKSPFLCVNRSTIWYDFHAGAKALRYSMNIQL